MAILAIEECPRNRLTGSHLNYLLGIYLQTLNKDLQKSLEHYDLALRRGYDEFSVKFQRGIFTCETSGITTGELWESDIQLVPKELQQLRPNY